MSKIDELLKNEKVEWKKLGEIGEIYGGLTGKTKQDFNNGNAKFITYKNVYLNPATDLNVKDKVKIKAEENQRKLMYGDILFTGSSETPDECGMSSVITTELTEGIYLNSFCFLLRLNNSNLLLPDFSKHLFRSEALRMKIVKTASGVTRFNISKDLMKKIEIPIPSLKTQEKIVNILDKFTNYVTELQAELQARTKQYEYYREKLIGFGGNKYNFVKISEIAEYSRGKIDNKNIERGNYIGVENLLQNKRGFIKKNIILSPGSSILFSQGSILIGNIRPYLKKILYSEFSGGTNGDVLVINRLKSEEKYVDSKFLYYCLASDVFFDYVNKNSRGAKMPRGDKDKVMEFEIPLPNFEEQKKIVEKLDKFETVVYSIESGLPKLIEGYQKMYEFYRTKLLNFKKEV